MIASYQVIFLHRSASSSDRKTRQNLVQQKPSLAGMSLHHELGVSFSTGDDHVHPDPHGLRRGGDHVVDPIVSLHTEC